MPLYNKKPGYAREAVKAKETTPVAVPMSTVNEYGSGMTLKLHEIPQPPPKSYGYTEDYNESSKSETSMSSYGFASGFTMTGSSTEGLTTFPSFGGSNEVSSAGNNTSTYMSNPSNIPTPEIENSKAEKEDSSSAPTGPVALPDDFQHALDLIYAGNGGKPGPITFPPPSIVPPPAPAPAPVPAPAPPPANNYG